MRAKRVGLLILYPLRCNTGSTAPSVIGLRNLLLCQLVARGPVSDSPSPTMTSVIKSGWSYTVPYDHPDLITLVMVGDGESETGPLATSWHSNKFLNPITDGAVLPVLHLNGYKINNPTVLARKNGRVI